jgi:kinesin family protein 20
LLKIANLKKKKNLDTVTFRAILMRGFDLDSSDTKDSISSVSSGSLKDWNIRARDETVCALQHPQDYFSVWVSYCEIYNEQAFDLLDGCDKKKKRVALRITEDRKGKFFVKGNVCYLILCESFFK